MRRWIAIAAVLLLIVSAAVSFGSEVEYEYKKIYFADARLFKLIGVNTQINKADPQSQAKEMLDIIIEGHDDNKKIKRVFANVRDGMSVKVKDNVAYVDIKEKLAKQQEGNRETEALAIYSVVNSLTGIDGIDIVKFTVGGRMVKDFMGHFDMREGFIANYMY